jgi:addiction module HigA family antidote
MYDPAHPGELIKETIEALREETGKPYTVQQIANGLNTTRKTLSAIINGKQSVTPEMAIKLAAAFRNTTPGFWLLAQDNYNLAKARRTVDTTGTTVFWKPAA